MELKDQVISLETSKRLKELGVKQKESIFMWVRCTRTQEYKLETFKSPFHGIVTNYHAAGWDHELHPMFSTFTASELAEMLPEVILFGEYNHRLTVEKVAIGYTVSYEGSYGMAIITKESLVEALATCLIHLLENKIISIN